MFQVVAQSALFCTRLPTPVKYVAQLPPIKKKVPPEELVFSTSGAYKGILYDVRNECKRLDIVLKEMKQVTLPPLS